jgi:hypothetical protein
MDIGNILGNKLMNSGATLATISNLDKEQLDTLLQVKDKWVEISCSDGSKAFILRNFGDAFEIYGNEWNTTFGNVTDHLNQLKSNADSESSNKLDRILNNLNDIHTALMKAYNSAYLTFAAKPCDNESQDVKHRMDRTIVTASLLLLGIKASLDPKDVKNLDEINNRVLKLIDKITDSLIIEGQDKTSIRINTNTESTREPINYVSPISIDAPAISAVSTDLKHIVGNTNNEPLKVKINIYILQRYYLRILMNRFFDSQTFLYSPLFT